jgi:hypothetical protein
MQQSKTGKTHICELSIEVMVALALLEPWPYWIEAWSFKSPDATWALDAMPASLHS